MADRKAPTPAPAEAMKPDPPPAPPRKEGIITGLVRELAEQLPGPEVCACAAVLMPDGYIVRGHRHADALRTAGRIPRYATVKWSEAQQGFYTTRERFVDRAEGLALQVAAGRASADHTRGGDYGWQLYSEDLY